MNAELEKLLRRAPRAVEELLKRVRVAAEEPNTQAKAGLLGREAMNALQEAHQVYTALALMKNCELISYDEPTGQTQSDWDRAMNWVLSTLDQEIKDCEHADDGSGAAQAVEGSLKTIRKYLAKNSREQKQKERGDGLKFVVDPYGPQPLRVSE